VQMLPNVLLSTSSSAEARVFKLLEDVDLGDGWTAFHSLNCSEHAYKHWAEIDFLILGPSAVLVLEVKGGRVQCRDGLWTYTDRFGRSRTSSEGPYGQARSAMYALRGMLVDRYRVAAGTLRQVAFGFGVIFADIDWDIDTPECPAAVTADRGTITSHAALGRYLKALVAYWREKHANAAGFAPADLRALRNCLRPDVDVYPPLTLRLGTALHEMQQLTEEQYERLDCLEQNERVIMSGGAGTGKTFLLIQFARRQAALGKTVTVVVHSDVLAAYLRKTCAESHIAIATPHRLGSIDAADVLLVDEGQDLMTFDALSKLSMSVKGGLDNGRWCWFMDENNQSGVAGVFDPEALEYLQTGLDSGKPVRFSLHRNCRNTKEIVRQVHLWTGADIGRTEVTGRGAAPEIVVVHDAGSADAVVYPVLRKLLDEGTSPDEIGLVTGSVTPPAFFSALPTAIRRALTPLTPATAASDLQRRIVWGPPSAFKGLERPIALVLAFDDDQWRDDAALYVASTRANFGLWVFASPLLAARLRGNKNDRTLSNQQTR
jgi:hypothetical protein